VLVIDYEIKRDREGKEYFTFSKRKEGIRKG
jgi:hypothetical protein